MDEPSTGVTLVKISFGHSFLLPKKKYGVYLRLNRLGEMVLMSSHKLFYGKYFMENYPKIIPVTFLIWSEEIAALNLL